MSPPPSRRKPLPRWTVVLNIKTGADGRHKTIPELEAIDGQTGTFDLNTTWQEAFQSHFGVAVDPLRYSVMRVHRGDTSGMPPKHNLLEDISVLMGEYKKILACYTIHVVENKLFSRIKVNPNNINVSPSNPTGDKSDEMPETEQNENSRRVSVASGARKDMYPGGAKSVRVLPVSAARGKRESTRQSFVATRSDNGVVIPVQIKSSASTVAANTSAQRKVFSRKPGLVEARGSPNVTSPPGLGPVIINRYPNQETGAGPRHLFNDSDCELGNGLNSGNQMDVDDDVLSVGSQDSQAADLEELGIRNSDIRTLFLDRAKKNYTNSQLLKARHELETLKYHKSNRWTKWTLSAPITTNIMRDLLGI